VAFVWNDFQAENISAKSVAIEIVGKHRRTGALATGYYSTDGFVTGPSDTPGNTPYLDRVIGGLTVDENMFTSDGRFGGQSSVSFGQIVLNNADGALDVWEDYAIDDQTITVKIAEVGTAIGDYETVATLNGSSLAVEWDQITFTVTDKQSKLVVPIQTETYAGTGPALWFTRANDHYLSSGTLDEGRIVADVFDPIVFGIEAWILIEPPSASETWTLFAIGDNTGVDSSSLSISFQFAADNTFTITVKRYYDLVGVQRLVDQWDATGIAASNTGKLVHFAWFNIGENDKGILLDGTELSSTFVGGGLGGVLTQSNELRIGTNFTTAGAPADSWDGMISDVRAWSVTRTASQVQANKDRALEGDEEGLIHYWRLNDNIDTTPTPLAADYGPNDLKLTLTGTTGTPDWVSGLQGGEDLQGKTKPLAYGRNLNINPALVGAADLIYQVHDGEVNAINAVYDKGGIHTLATTQTDLKTFLTTVPTSYGTYDVYLPLGLFRMRGGIEGGIIAADVDGVEGADGTYLRHYEEIVREIVTDKGGLTDPTDLDTASFDAIEDEPVGGMGIYIAPGQNETIASVIDSLSASVTGYWYFTSAGKLFLGILGLPRDSPDISFTVDDDTTEFKRIQGRIPSYRLRVGYKRNWTVQNEDDTLTSLPGTERAEFLSKKFREVEIHDDSIKDIHPLASDLPVEDDGLLSTVTGATIEARRQMKLYGRHVQIFKATRPGLKWADVKLGDCARVTHDRFGLDNGEDFCVVGIRREYGQETAVELTIWRPESAVIYTIAGTQRTTRDGSVRVAR
jgi:hypothetical protein